MSCPRCNDAPTATDVVCRDCGKTALDALEAEVSALRRQIGDAQQKIGWLQRLQTDQVREVIEACAVCAETMPEPLGPHGPMTQEQHQFALNVLRATKSTIANQIRKMQVLFVPLEVV